MLPHVAEARGLRSGRLQVRYLLSLLPVHHVPVCPLVCVPVPSRCEDISHGLGLIRMNSFWAQHVWKGPVSKRGVFLCWDQTFRIPGLWTQPVRPLPLLPPEGKAQVPDDAPSRLPSSLHPSVCPPLLLPGTEAPSTSHPGGCFLCLWPRQHLHQSCHLRALGASGDSWGLLGVPGGSWGHMGTPGDSWGLLGSPGDSWGFQGAPGGFWEHVGTPGGSWGLCLSGDHPLLCVPSPSSACSPVSRSYCC